LDATTDGRPLKLVSIIDEHTRECLSSLVERSVTAERLSTNSTASPFGAATRRCCVATTLMAKDLDAQAEAFRTRPLDGGPYTFVAADARC
jgi:hypothetical protein